MGRKGGGRAAFMKAAQARSRDAAFTEEERAENAMINLESIESVPMKTRNNAETEETLDVSIPTETETKGQMTQRHKREMKSLKDKVKRLGKKGKEEGATLLKEMEERHEKEMNALDEVSQSNAVEQATISFYSADVGENRKSKAQKRREKLLKEELEREKRIAEEIEAMGESDREAEEKILQGKLHLSGLAIMDIPSDGHCLYRSIADQIQSLPDHGSQIAQVSCIESKDLSFLSLRKICADSLRSHKEQFIDFVSGSDLTQEKDCSREDLYEAYCSEVENTAAWGGQLEIQALCLALCLHVRIHTADMDTIELSPENSGSLSTINICYLKHAFGLGEHYQSTTTIQQS